MNGIDMKYLCTVIGNLSGIPIRLYDGDALVFQYSLVQLPVDPLVLWKEPIWAVASHVGYFITDDFHYFGIINSGSQKCIIGPTRQVACSTQDLRKLAFRADVPADDMDDFINGMQSIVRMPLDSVMQMLCTINYVLNDEKLELKDIAIFEEEQNSLQVLLQQQQNSRLFQEEEKSDSERIPKADMHNTYVLEKQMLRMVRKGDTAALKEWISRAPAVRGGTLAKDQLRQLKNTFIVTATLVSRAAIEGGMELEDAFSLSDAYIQKCELLDSLERITNLQYHMVLEFASRLEKVHFGTHPTRLVIDVSNYIRHHLSEPITAEEIAKALFLSRPYLSRKFREESGESLTDFILKEKTEEAKRLLRYSDKSATAISAYLGFSSPGHFSRVFRKYTGQTPMEYREKHDI
ncbi:MAG: helix-turn-helix domain-containing protein [Anaerovoracaceae bacterium]